MKLRSRSGSPIIFQTAIGIGIAIGIAIAIFDEDRDRDRDLNLGDRANALDKSKRCIDVTQLEIVENKK